MKMKKLMFSIMVAGAILSGCDKSRTESGSNTAGKLSVKITDDPFNINYVESATVTITKIEARMAYSNSENPFVVLTDTPVTVDLINLRNGITQELVNLQIPAGEYDLVRIYVDEAGLKIKDQPGMFKVKVPSGSQTGIKVFISPVLHVADGISSELLLDFDLSKSFVMRGNMQHSGGVNGFIFKPCIRAVNNSTTGRIEGYIKDTTSAPVADAKVWVMQDTVISSSFTDSEGHYVLPGLPAGIYSLFATQDGFDTVSVNGISVYGGSKTNHDFILKNPLFYVSSAIDNATPDKLTITFNTVLAAIVPADTSFIVKVNSIARAVNGVSVNAEKVTLTLASAVMKDEVVTVSYIKPDTLALQTDNGYKAASFADRSVTNNVGQK
jgi:uncharacterized repeat protein (TIGR02059 family)